VRRLAVLACGVAIVVGLVASGSERTGASAWAQAPQKPNLIVITTDDQSLDDWSAQIMPRTFARLEQGGTFVPQAIAVPPLCCPARASLLTGSYPHNHGVKENVYAWLRGKANTLPVWLRRAGYRTAFFGKFLNGYHRFAGVRPAPGFDHWWGVVGNFDRYYEYAVSENGYVRGFGPRSEDYLTTQINQRAVEWIEARAGGDKPFFAWISHFAPHATSVEEHLDPACPTGGSPAIKPGDLDETPGGGPPLRDRPVPHEHPAYNEADVSDKPRFVRELPPLSEAAQERIERRARCRWAALQEVDRGVEEVFAALERTGQLERTVVVLFSDNGVMNGEHRITGGKAVPYDGALRIPFALWVPEQVLGEAPPPSLEGLVGTIDVAPTLLELARTRPCNSRKCRRLDGVSLVDALRGEGTLSGRRLFIEIGKGCPRFRTVRTGRYHYTEWMRKPGSGLRRCTPAERELYDLREDPGMLENLLADAGYWDHSRFARLADRLSRCSGIRGRDPRLRVPKRAKARKGKGRSKRTKRVKRVRVPFCG
jgi:arylsulfatase A-like enzyme